MAASWYFYDAQGKKQGPITSAQLKALAAGGTITPTTRIETDDGKESVARKVQGLFPSESSDVFYPLQDELSNEQGRQPASPVPMPSPEARRNPASAPQPEFRNLLELGSRVRFFFVALLLTGPLLAFLYFIFLVSVDPAIGHSVLLFIAAIVNLVFFAWGLMILISATHAFSDFATIMVRLEKASRKSDS